MKRITKYFSASTLPYIERGSVRFGSLASYRGQENESTCAAARFTDEREGLLTFTLNAEGSFDEIRVPNLGEFRSRHLSMSRNSFTTEYIGHVYCVSKGEYSESHHRKMLEGTEYKSGLRYTGNPDLTHYVVYDFDKFQEALNWLHPKNVLGMCKPIEMTCWGLNVIYSEKDFEISLRGKGAVSLESDSLWYRAMRLKHPYFRVENEFRFIIDNFLTKNVQTIGDGKIVTSPQIKDAIVEIGSI